MRSVRSHCHQMLSRPKVSLRSIAQILGLLESYRPAIWRAPLHMRRLQAQLTLGLKNSLQSYEAEVNLSPLSKQELQWCIQNIELCNGSPVTTPPPRAHLTIFTDASKQRWGAVCDNQQANGKWSATEKLLHINILELKGAFLAIQALLKNKRSMTVSLNMDNSSAVAYINHKAGHTRLSCFISPWPFGSGASRGIYSSLHIMSQGSRTALQIENRGSS